MFKRVYIDGLVQDCSNSSALAMELLHSCTKPSISFTNIEIAGVVEILIVEVRDPSILYKPYQGCCRPGDPRSQDIGSRDIRFCTATKT